MSGKLKGKFTIAEIKKHLLTAISYLLPLIVASGLLIAIGNLTGGTTISSLDDLGSMTVPSAFTTLGGMGMGLIPAFIGGYIAYSVADRPGIAPGFLMGEIASFLGAGFLGGLIGGLIVGYIALVIESYLKVPKWAQALMPMMIIPLLSAMLHPRRPAHHVHRRPHQLHHRPRPEPEGPVRLRDRLDRLP